MQRKLFCPGYPIRRQRVNRPWGQADAGSVHRNKLCTRETRVDSGQQEDGNHRWGVSSITVANLFGGQSPVQRHCFQQIFAYMRRNNHNAPRLLKHRRSEQGFSLLMCKKKKKKRQLEQIVLNIANKTHQNVHLICLSGLPLPSVATSWRNVAEARPALRWGGVMTTEPIAFGGWNSAALWELLTM